MLMPQWVDMSMDMERLRGPEFDQLVNNNAGNPVNESGQPINIAAHITHHLQNGHDTGGIGDLGMYALFKLFDNGAHHVHVTAGLSAPTGNVNIQLRRNHTVDAALTITACNSVAAPGFQTQFDLYRAMGSILLGRTDQRHRAYGRPE